jgi:hypothetical protein
MFREALVPRLRGRAWRETFYQSGATPAVAGFSPSGDVNRIIAIRESSWDARRSFSPLATHFFKELSHSISASTVLSYSNSPRSLRMVIWMIFFIEH